jgi:hypothetical protein
MFKKYFVGSTIFTVISLILAGYIGYSSGGTFSALLTTVFITFVLGALEVSLSFDNAIVNAQTLSTMSDKWKHRFLTWGMIIAVFGMRIIFPLAIVSIAGSFSPWEALMLAINDPSTYERTLTSTHVELAAFGGAFLLMVGLKFFFDVEKNVHWVKVIEKPLAKAGGLYLAEMVVAIIALLSTTHFLEVSQKLSFLTYGLIGLVTYSVVQWTSSILEGKNKKSLAGQAVKTGLSTFIYLEVLDATFSFDGVIGAFALSKDIFIIALGLGIGAMFVRSLTLMFVDRGTLAEYKYLEHGAFWAIIGLAVCMFLGLFIHVPEYITGLVGIILIALSFWSSLLHKKSYK